ncbi:hypothetical protein [Nocardioides sp.]|uniref:hypothetical protein n=1 Tax=Nocardioides sp. TaxID=35761 RepID=UPI0025FDFD72|nr:hypothetical protein [Nocardioides sp.]
MPFLVLLLATLLAPVPNPASAVLHAWDVDRSAAWAAGDPAALARLYTPRSPAGAADVAMLRAWQARGLRVVDLRMQLLAVETRRRTPDRLVVVVSDRLASGVAVGGGVRQPLPRDAVSTRRLVLVRVAGEWRVAQASPVRTTSPTVRSRNR